MQETPFIYWIKQPLSINAVQVASPNAFQAQIYPVPRTLFLPAALRKRTPFSLPDSFQAMIHILEGNIF
jgi:hypothetical protein